MRVAGEITSTPATLPVFFRSLSPKKSSRKSISNSTRFFLFAFLFHESVQLRLTVGLRMRLRRHPFPPPSNVSSCVLIMEGILSRFGRWIRTHDRFTASTHNESEYTMGRFRHAHVTCVPVGVKAKYRYPEIPYPAIPYPGTLSRSGC